MSTGATNVPARMLLGPGPSPVSDRVMRAMAKPVLSHLDPVMTIVDAVTSLGAHPVEVADRVLSAFRTVLHRT